MKKLSSPIQLFWTCLYHPAEILPGTAGPMTDPDY